MEFNEQWQIACANYVRDFDNHYPQSRLFAFLRIHPVALDPVQDETFFH